MLKKWLVALAIFFLLVVGLHSSLRLGLLSGPLKRWTQAMVARHTQWPVEIGRVHLSLVPTALILTDVRVPHPKGVQAPLLEVKEARVSVSPWSLLTEVTIIKKVRLREPRLFLTGGDEARGEVRRPVTNNAPLPMTAFVIRQIEIQQGTLQVQQPRWDLRIGLSAVEGKIHPDLRMEHFHVFLAGGSTLIGIRGEEILFDHGTAKFSFHPDHLEVRSVELEGSTIRLAMSGNLQDLADPLYDVILDAAFPVSELNGLLDLKQRLSGQVKLHGKIEGRWPAVSMGGTVVMSDLFLEDIAIGQVKTAFDYKDRTLRLRDLSSSILGGEAQGQATVDLSGAPFPYQLFVTFTRLSAGSSSALLGQPGLFPNQLLDGQLELSGQGLDRASLSGRGKLKLTLPPDASLASSRPLDLREWTGHLREVTTDFELDRGVLYLKEAAVQSTHSLASLQGRIGRQGELELGFHLKSRRVEEFASLLKLGFLEGTLDLKGTLRGTLKDPELNANGSMQQARIQGRPFERISGHLSYRYPKLVFTGARFREKEARYELNGFVSFDPALPVIPFFDLKARITQGLPREVVAIFYRELPITVAVTGNLTARGHPKQFRLTARLTAGSGNIYGQDVDSGRLDLIITHQRVSFKNVKAMYRESSLLGEGWIQYDGHFKVTVTSPQTHLRDLAWGQKPFRGLSAILSGELQGEGLLERPGFQTRILLKDIRYHDQPFGDGAIRATLLNRVLSVEANLENGMAGKGTITLVTPFPFEMDLVLRRFQSKPALNLLGSSYLAKVSATATGSLSAKGSLKNLDQVSLMVNLQELIFDLAGYTLSNEEDIHLELKAQVLKIQSLRLKGEATSLAISGDLNLFKSYRLFIDGEADLDLLRVVTHEITYGRGKASLSLQVLDQWERPEIRGSVTIQNGTLKSETLNQAITIKSLTLSFNKHQIILESFEGEIGGGRLTAGGQFNLAGLAVSGFGINLELEGARITTVQGLSGSLDASLFLHGNGGSKSLRGEILLRRASYERRLDWKRSVVDFLKRKRQKPRAVPVIGDVSLHIQVYGKENIRINNNLARLPLEIDLLIKGTLNHPVLLGRIEAKGGVIFFRHHDFKVISGTVDFIDPDRIHPVFDIKATTRVRTYQIDLSLVGPLDHFDLSLSSDPPLRDQTEILALLTFGKTPEEIAQSRKEIGATEAASLMTGEIQEVVEEKVEALTGIDRIQLEPYYSSTKAAGTPRLSVSKRLWEERLYVTYATTLDPSGEEAIQIEYILSDNISLIGGRDELGRLGGDLKFRFEFR